MTNELPLTPLPVESAAVTTGDLEAGKAGRPISSQHIPAVPQVSHVEARPQLPATESKRQNARSMNSSSDLLLTVEEFADNLRVTPACVRKWILTRRVGVVKIGRLVRLRSSELRRIVEEGSRPRAEPR